MRAAVSFAFVLILFPYLLCIGTLLTRRPRNCLRKLLACGLA